MRRTARLEADSCRRQFGEEFRHLAAPQLAPQHWLFDLVNPMNLKDMFRRVQTNSDNRHSDGSSWLRLQHPQPGTFDAVGAVHSNILLIARPRGVGKAMQLLARFEPTQPWIPAFPTALVRGLKAHGKAQLDVIDFRLGPDICPASRRNPARQIISGFRGAACWR